ncbi:hypothetical protein L6164_018920 [Bauhinia variegata]|uniref:Uncharacterized protein n=1 Tax=Bauhinia variegata TaxID=167791 RepID=A0ACB9NG89_BAUVA|nr:hypothetical protein L6164_018920 [Bauhinia variegata]
MSSWRTHNLEKGLSEKQNKIRKRGCSSSSSSSLVRRYRFKRAILVGKKGGSTTPVPMWKTRTKSPSMAMQKQDAQLAKALPFSGVASREKELSLSARKLAATLWEIDDLPPSGVRKDFEAQQMRSKKDFDAEQMRSKKETSTRQKAVSLSRSGLLRSHMSDPSYSPMSERMKGFEGDSCKRRGSVVSHKLQLADDYYFGSLDALSDASLMEVGNQPRSKTRGKCATGVKNCLKEARNGLSTSKKLIKVLNQMCLQEQNSSSIPLLLALGCELDRVRNQIDQVIQEQVSNENDVEILMKRFAEEKAAWKRRERENVRNAIKHLAEELEAEKKLRRQTERFNKKIAKEMANIKASHLKVSRELEREKRAKEILEQISDELARGIGEDRAQVEELKRESAKVREEVEKEREMLQLADVLREERVQMKLSEAKYQFEEKNAVLEKLRNELETSLRTKEVEENGDISPEFKKIKQLEANLKKTCWGFQKVGEEDDLEVGDGVVEHEGEDSNDSDLQSIELNMDNDNRSYKWSFACDNDAPGDVRRVSVDKESIGRKSYEKIQWGSICFNKGAASFKKRDFGKNNPETSDQLRALIQDKDETENHMPIQSFPPQDTCGEIGENSLVLEVHDLKQEGRISG